jgi:gamma-glutamyltranspeptidase/glutathione hydrolase
MCPVIVQDKASKDVKLLIGTPGGPCIIAYLTRRMLDILDHKIPIHKAAARPNYVPMSNDTKVEYEKDLLTDTEKAYFKNKDFDLVPSKFISGFQIVENDSGFLSGASDPRRDGLSIGGDK